MFISRYLAFFALWLPAIVFSQHPGQVALDALARDPALAHASLSACVIDVKTGQVVAAYDPERSLSPASTQKVITTATALALLGADFTYTTELQYDGMLGARGILMGNLYLSGSGDPTLGSDRLDSTPDLAAVIERFRLAVQQKGIRRVEGYIIGDASRWGTAASGRDWQWADMGNYYGAGAWALNLHENLYYLRFQQTSTLGATPRISAVEPDIPGLNFVNEVTSARYGRGGDAYIYGAPYTYLRYVRGTIGVGKGVITIEGSIPDPPLFAAQQLEQGLLSVGIPSSKGAANLRELALEGFQPEQREVLYRHTSPSLRTIVGRTNQKSVNLYSECLLRTLGDTQKGAGTTDAGIEVMEAYWKDQGLDLSGVYFSDGSGLAPDNALPTRFLAALLAKAAGDDRVFPALYESLPEIGNTGRLRAKSGTLNRVRAFAGYATDRQGRQLAFAIIAQNFDGPGGAMRRELENWMGALTR